LESGHGMLSLTDFRKSLFLGQTETSKLIWGNKNDFKKIKIGKILKAFIYKGKATR
jgi:hypothetical protein